VTERFGPRKPVGGAPQARGRADALEEQTFLPSSCGYPTRQRRLDLFGLVQSGASAISGSFR
jgi:hypothetical protein